MLVRGVAVAIDKSKSIGARVRACMRLRCLVLLFHASVGGYRVLCECPWRQHSGHSR